MKIITWLKYFKSKVDSFDFFELGHSAALYYLLIFLFVPFLVLVGFSIKFDWGIFRAQDLNLKAFFYLILGLIFLIVGYSNRFPKFVARRLPNFFKSEWNFKNVPLIFSITFIIGIGLKLLRIFAGAYSYHWQQKSWLQSSSFYSLLGILEWLPYVALIIAFASYFYLKKIGDKRYRFWRVAAWVTFAVEIVYGLPSCNRAFVITPIIFYLIVRSYLSRIEWWKIVLIALGIVLVLFPVGNICRNPRILNAYFKKDVAKVVVTGDRVVVKEVAVGEPAKKIEAPIKVEEPTKVEEMIKDGLDRVAIAGNLSVDSFFSRINNFVVLDRLLEMNQPFLYGKSLLKFFISLGPPRFIWKNKPIISGGTDFGHQSGLTASNVESVVGVTIVGDWYMNFGLLGIILGMFLMGMIFRFIFDYFIKVTAISLSGVMIYSIFWINIIKGMEDWIAPVYAGLIKTLVMLAIVHYFLTRCKKEVSKN